MSRRLLRLVLAPVLALAALLLFFSSMVLATQLLINPGLNNPATYADTGRDWRTYDEKVAAGWWYYYVADGTYDASGGARKLHWMSSQQFGQAFGGLDYYREGDAAQVIWSSYDFDAGIYQQVTGLTVGRDYAFEAAMTSYWRGSGYPVTNGKMKKCLGVDPTGGTDPTASNVIWDWANCDSTDKTWPYLDMAATARATTMTVFVRIQSPENDSYSHTDLNYVYIDDGRMDLAPTVSLTAPAVSTSTVSFSWTGSATAGWSLKGVEVQVRDDVDRVWHIVQGKTGGNSSHTFIGQPGHIYTIRARPWQKQGNYDLPGLWVEKQVQVGGAFAGYVRNNFGAGISGALVSVTGSSTYSQQAGFFGLQPPTYGQPYPITASASGYISPPPISATVADDLSVTPITITLKPANDGITNGDFESSTNGWLTSGTGSAALFSGGHRSGAASLVLTGAITLTQPVALSGVYNPALAFWVKPVTLSGSDRFEASLIGEGGAVLASEVFTAGTTTQWQPAWLSLGLPAMVSDTLTATFRLTGASSWLYLDEVSLGDGPHTIFLPVILAPSTP